MSRPSIRVGTRVVLAALLLGGVGVGAGLFAQRLLPEDGVVAAGVVLDGVEVAAAARIDDLAEARIEALLRRRVRVQHDGKTLFEASLAELGASVDRQAAKRALAAVGRQGSLLERLDQSWRARRGKIAVALPLRLPVEPIARKLAAFKQHSDQRPVAARWNFAEDSVTEHRAGVVVDIYGAAEAVLQAARSTSATVADGAADGAADAAADGAANGALEITVPIERTEPAATSAVVTAMDRSELVSSYQTRFAYLGGQAGRANNVTRAAQGLDGLVMMPGEVLSFNALVGPRSIDNGFSRAGEIYKGEMRMGVGGGTCQVASTFHAAAYLAGLEVVERSPHSRPSGYIGIGLDATVAYPHVDLKMLNPYPFPVLIHAWTEEGVMSLELLGAGRPAEVDYDATTVGVRPYKRKIKRAHWLAEGNFVQKQKGIRGISIQKTRLIRYSDGSRRVEKTTDTYPPTNEVYYLAPDVDEAEVLPPLPAGAES